MGLAAHLLLNSNISVKEVASQCGYVDTSKRMVDAWGNEFEIECTGNEIGVFSAGADGQFSTEDDID